MVTGNRECLPLDTGIIYGPVKSRRLGHSLGINLCPTQRKVCSFDCVYCHFGWSEKVTMDAGEYEKNYAEPEQVAATLEAYLVENKKPDYITFSGTGEGVAVEVEVGVVVGGSFFFSVLSISPSVTPNSRSTQQGKPQLGPTTSNQVPSSLIPVTGTVCPSSRKSTSW